MKIRAVIIVMFIISALYLAGCSMTLNKYYNYKPIKISHDVFDLRIKLIGVYKSNEQTTIKGPPYLLLISFRSNSTEAISVSLKSVKLYDPETKELVYKMNETSELLFKKDSDGTINARMMTEGLDLEYKQYNLLLKYRMRLKDSFVEDEVEITLEKDYKEDRSNDFWDKLMSV